MEPPRAKVRPRLSVFYGVRHQYLNWWLWLHVLLQLRNPKLAAKGKAAPKGEAVTPAVNANGLAKAKALGDNAVAPVLPVACGLLGGGTVLPPPVGPDG